MAKSKAVARRKGFTIPLATVAGFVPLGVHALQDYRTGGWASLGDGLSRRLTGFGTEGSGGIWEPKYLAQGLLPILGGAAVHKIASRLGINRLLAQTGLPFRI